MIYSGHRNNVSIYNFISSLLAIGQCILSHLHSSSSAGEYLVTFMLLDSLSIGHNIRLKLYPNSCLWWSDLFLIPTKSKR